MEIKNSKILKEIVIGPFVYYEVYIFLRLVLIGLLVILLGFCLSMGFELGPFK